MAAQSTIQALRAAWPMHKEDAKRAFDLFNAYCGEGSQRRRVPGIGTTERLALRIYHGKSIEEAAAAEYLYRWRLAVKAPDQVIGALARDSACSVFGVPHTIGL